jgi:hypothetical protein
LGVYSLINNFPEPRYDYDYDGWFCYFGKIRSHGRWCVGGSDFGKYECCGLSDATRSRLAQAALDRLLKERQRKHKRKRNGKSKVSSAR